MYRTNFFLFINYYIERKKFMISNRLIILTPYSGSEEILKSTIESVITQLDKNDIWIIVLDNQNLNNFIIKEKYDQLVFLNYFGKRGAGNCRNLGLDYIAENIDGDFILLPFDGDDCIEDQGIKLIKKTMITNNFEVVSFAHRKIWPDGTSRVVGYKGVFDIKDLLKRYVTPCGSTVIKISDPKILKFFYLDLALEQMMHYFYQVVKYFGKFKCFPEVILNYKIGNSKSLSGKKINYDIL